MAVWGGGVTAEGGIGRAPSLLFCDWDSFTGSAAAVPLERKWAFSQCVFMKGLLIHFSQIQISVHNMCFDCLNSLAQILFFKSLDNSLMLRDGIFHSVSLG